MHARLEESFSRPSRAKLAAMACLNSSISRRIVRRAILAEQIVLPDLGLRRAGLEPQRYWVWVLPLTRPQCSSPRDGDEHRQLIADRTPVAFEPFRADQGAAVLLQRANDLLQLRRHSSSDGT